jgi:H2-forming N5,N10-methylenetetrahydromethanopterin dehydrogenase-like enzyme
MSDGGAGREDSVGGAVHQESAQSAGRDEVQTEPVLEQNSASLDEKLDGIAAQTRVDLGEESQDRYEEVLRQRLADADIQLTDDDVSALARRSSPGSGGGGV